jgi:hypothetical protein
MTWEVGDLALCVDDGRCTCCGEQYFRNGGVYTVAGAWPLDGEVWLSFEDISPLAHDEWWNAVTFRKIIPDAHEACEEEFVTLLKRTKRKVSA